MPSKEYKGNLHFNHVDTHMARFTLEQPGGIISKRELVVEPDFFPPDFELAEYDISGNFVFSVDIKKKKKKK